MFIISELADKLTNNYNKEAPVITVIDFLFIIKNLTIIIIFSQKSDLQIDLRIPLFQLPLHSDPKTISKKQEC